MKLLNRQSKIAFKPQLAAVMLVAGIGAAEAAPLQVSH